MTSRIRIVGPGEADAYWSEGTRSEIVLDASDTDAALSVLEELLPADADGPPLHSHPEEETFVILSGEMTVWNCAAPVEDSADPWTDAVRRDGVRMGAGERLTVPGGRAHCYRVEGSEPVRLIVLSRPSGLEAWTRQFGIAAEGAGLPPADLREPGPTREQVVAFSRSVGVRRHGAPAPSTMGEEPGAARKADRTAAFDLQRGHARDVPGGSRGRAYFVAAGTAILTCAAGSHEAVTGSYAFVPPQITHQWSAREGARVLLLA